MLRSTGLTLSNDRFVLLGSIGVMLTLLSLTGCKAGLSDSTGSKTSASKTNSSGSTEETPPEQETVEEPVSVGGSFLFCMEDEKLPTTASDRVGIGCRVGNTKEKSSISESLHTSPIMIVDNDNKPEATNIAVASDESTWHWTTDLPADKLDKLSPMLFEMKGFDQKPNVYHGAIITDIAAPIKVQKLFDDYMAAGLFYDPPLSVNKSQDWRDENGAKIVKNIIPPLFIPVIAGNAGNYQVSLTFKMTGQSEVVCTYKGGASTGHPTSEVDIQLGRFYAFEKCSGADSHPAVITADFVAAEVNSGDTQDHAKMTVVFIPLLFKP